MADAKTDQEPSIEEILQSIRQIISDDEAPQPAAEPAPPKPAAKPVEPPPAPVKQAPPPPPPAETPVVLDLVDIVEEGPAPAYTPPPQPVIEDNGDGLLSDITADAASGALAKLLAGNIAVERQIEGRIGNVTLEDIARDLLRPLVKTWLDQNLPRVIEKMVAKEIEKLSRRALDN